MNCRRGVSALAPGGKLDGLGIQSSGAVGTDTDSLTAREGATPENALGTDQRKRSAPPRKGVAPSLA